MKTIINKFIPFHGYLATAFYSITFWNKEYSQDFILIKKIIKNHENIHMAQMQDFCKWLPIGGTIFYIVYLIEWLFRLLFTKDFMSYDTYKHVTFEQEALQNEENFDYLKFRKKFNQYK